MNIKKKLYRTTENRMIAGVCGGLGEYFDIDPVLFRIVFLLLALMGGSGVFFYIFCIIVIPKQGRIKEHQERFKGFVDELQERAREFTAKKKSPCCLKRNIAGVLIILLGFILLLRKISPVPFLRWDLFWSIAIIVVGIYIIFKKSKKH